METLTFVSDTTSPVVREHPLLYIPEEFDDVFTRNRAMHTHRKTLWDAFLDNPALNEFVTDFIPRKRSMNHLPMMDSFRIVYNNHYWALVDYYPAQERLISFRYIHDYFVRLYGNPELEEADSLFQVDSVLRSKPVNVMNFLRLVRKRIPKGGYELFKKRMASWFGVWWKKNVILDLSVNDPSEWVKHFWMNEYFFQAFMKRNKRLKIMDWRTGKSIPSEVLFEKRSYTVREIREFELESSDINTLNADVILQHLDYPSPREFVDEVIRSENVDLLLVSILLDKTKNVRTLVRSRESVLGTREHPMDVYYNMARFFYVSTVESFDFPRDVVIALAVNHDWLLHLKEVEFPSEWSNTLINGWYLFEYGVLMDSWDVVKWMKKHFYPDPIEYPVARTVYLALQNEVSDVRIWKLLLRKLPKDRKYITTPALLDLYKIFGSEHDEDSIEVLVQALQQWYVPPVDDSSFPKELETVLYDILLHTTDDNVILATAQNAEFRRYVQQLPDEDLQEVLVNLATFTTATEQFITLFEMLPEQVQDLTPLLLKFLARESLTEMFDLLALFPDNEVFPTKELVDFVVKQPASEEKFYVLESVVKREMDATSWLFDLYRQQDSESISRFKCIGFSLHLLQGIDPSEETGLHYCLENKLHISARWILESIPKDPKDKEFQHIQDEYGKHYGITPLSHCFVSRMPLEDIRPLVNNGMFSIHPNDIVAACYYNIESNFIDFLMDKIPSDQLDVNNIWGAILSRSPAHDFDFASELALEIIQGEERNVISRLLEKRLDIIRMVRHRNLPNPDEAIQAMYREYPRVEIQQTFEEF